MFDTLVGMLVCVWIPRFSLRVLAHRHEPTAPVAVHDTLDAQAVVACNAVAGEQGVRIGMPLSRALGCCSELRLIEYDTARVEAQEERFLQRLEGIGAAVEAVRPGQALLSARPLLRLYGGVPGVVSRIRDLFPIVDELRIGVAPNRFAAEVAAYRAAPGESMTIEQHRIRDVLAPLPIGVLPLDDRMRAVWTALGLRTLGDVAAIAEHQIADRFGTDGVVAWKLARGVDERRLVPRMHQEHIEEELAFPEATGSLVTLTRAVRVLVERALSRPLFEAYAPRTVVVVAYLVSDGSWRSDRVLRQPTVDVGRVALTATAELGAIPAPVERLQVRLEQLTPHSSEQCMFGSAQLQRRTRLREGIAHVQEALDEEALLSVLEIAPESRVPERRAVLVPADARQLGGGAVGA